MSFFHGVRYSRQRGSKIHASIRHALIYKFQNDISEGHVYAIQNFSVAPNSGIYRTTHHPYKINFQFGTKVSLLNVNLVPDIKPQYTPLSLLTTTAFNTDYLVGKSIFLVPILLIFLLINIFVKVYDLTFMNCILDILGLLVGVGTERELQVDGKNKIKCHSNRS